MPRPSRAPRLARLLAAVLAASAPVACVWETDLPAGATDIAVVPDRELLVTDDAVLAPLSANAGVAPLSFRAAAAALPLRDDGATLRWLRAWSARLAEEGHADRAAAFDARVTCRWLRAVPANACDASCAECASEVLAPGAAPFRLVAVANRTDLSVMPDRAAGGGEGRLVFALTDGPADDPASPPLPVTVILEYAQAGTALEWEQRWHALGAESPADFPAALAGLAGGFVGAGALAQLRTADALTGPLVLHEFHLAAGDLVAASVRNTPAYARVAPADVVGFVAANQAAFEDGTALFPRAWWAASSSPAAVAPAYLAALPEHDLVAKATCGGCHAQTASGFQIDPLATGAARVSRFLSDPTKDGDELRRRVTWMQLTLAGSTS
jgi:hypothetical protein